MWKPERRFEAEGDFKICLTNSKFLNNFLTFLKMASQTLLQLLMANLRTTNY